MLLHIKRTNNLNYMQMHIQQLYTNRPCIIPHQLRSVFSARMEWREKISYRILERNTREFSDRPN
jgi:hypothetical protein